MPGEFLGSPPHHTHHPHCTPLVTDGWTSSRDRMEVAYRSAPWREVWQKVLETKYSQPWMWRCCSIDWTLISISKSSWYSLVQPRMWRCCSIDWILMSIKKSLWYSWGSKHFRMLRFQILCMHSTQRTSVLYFCIQLCDWRNSECKFNKSHKPVFEIHCGLHGVSEMVRYGTVRKTLADWWT